MSFSVVKTTLDGSEKTLSIPDGVESICLFANGGDVTITQTSGGTAFTIKNGVYFSLDIRSPGSEVVYVNGASGILEALFKEGAYL